MKKVFAVVGLAVVVACGSSSVTPPASQIDITSLLTPPTSCAYVCPNTQCAEQSTPYECDALLPWSELPHDDACPKWDGKNPTPSPGACTASDPSGDATAYAGTDSAGHVVLADGHWLEPAGSQWVFTDLKGGMTSNVALVPSSSYALTVDTGFDDHVVRLVDVSQISSGADPTLAKVQFPAPKMLNSGIAIVPPGNHVYVATDDGVLQALALDATAKTLTEDDANSITLPQANDGSGNLTNWYASGVAASPDGKKLVAVSVNTKNVLVYDVDPASATYKQLLGQTDLGDREAFGVWFDPNDASGAHAYVSMWQDSAVLDVDLTNPAAPTIAHKFTTKKDPESIAFLDARYFAVSDDLGDSITIVDRTAATSFDTAIDSRVSLYGQEPTGLAYDAANHRLYATLSALNAVAAYDVSMATPPTLTFAGRLPMGYWPSAIATEADGTIVATTLRGIGEGPSSTHFGIGDGEIGDLMHGSIESVPLPSPPTLTQGDSDVTAFFDVAARAGSSSVSCPAGANDFPIPQDNASGPSTRIDHVFVIVRENKDYDGLFGDFPGGNGDPTLTLKTNASDMDKIWQNLRALAKTFAMSDNYYTEAIYSTQGHIWTTYGRANDFDERTWIESGDRGGGGRPAPLGGISDVGRPIEGSLFEWLDANRVNYDILGEIVGEPLNPSTTHPPYDTRYPGGPFQNIGFNDLQKACYAAARVRAFCNTGNVVYMTLPNDHTFGVSPTNPTPETFCAVNDEATGMFIDALSHSPLWATSLVMITEDDPSQGGEHVNDHRAPFVVISPFVKRGYVSHTHMDVASMHKILANVLGKPYVNEVVHNAAIPFDMFTSTPDYTPYTYAPRTWPLACGDSGSSGQSEQGEQLLTQEWDFSREDSQPGLDAQVGRWMRGKPLEKIPDAMLMRVRGQNLRMHKHDHDGLKGIVGGDDDDRR